MICLLLIVGVPVLVLGNVLGYAEGRLETLKKCSRRGDDAR